MAEIILDDMHAGRALRFDQPSHIFVATEPGEVPAMLDAMQRSIAAGHYLAGYLSYELGYALEPRLAACLPAQRRLPLLWFGQFDAPPRQFEGKAAQGLWPCERFYATPLAYEWNRAAYRERFAAVQRALAAGQTYEVNLSMRARFRLTGSARALYGRLRRTSGGAHGAFVDDGTHQLLSLSPELFYRLDPAGTITTQPMKGTAPRGADAAADAALREQLRTSGKNRAENLMIVDLIRNDLGRIATTGSVRVPRLFDIESFPTVHQMTSTVEATLRPGTALIDVLRALFPCGSVTGAPKIRTLQLIRDLEDSPRGAYCGAIGMWAPDGSARFNVAIRTLTLTDGVGELGIGGAGVSDSDADAEFDECHLKARFYERARRPLALIETLSLTPTPARRARHLQRLRRSAEALAIPFAPAEATAALDAATRNAPGDRRVRLLLQEDGRLSVALQPMPAPVSSLGFIVSRYRVHSSDPLNRHKTDWRDRYAQALAEARACGAAEAILCNERGELSEGTFTNLFIERAGRLVTPPLASGALPGCLRAELIATGRCIEAVLTVADLAHADRIWLGNSLRGLLPAFAINPESLSCAAPPPGAGGHTKPRRGHAHPASWRG